MTSLIQVVLGNQVKIATAFTDPDGTAIATDGATFTARSGQRTITATPSGVGTGQYETLFYPDHSGRWRFRIVGTIGGSPAAADEGEFEVASFFDS